MRYKDRREGAVTLASHLAGKYGGPNCVVFGLPRGGVITASVVAQKLDAELDVVVTRKIGHPNNPEYALGAVAEGGFLAINENEIGALPANLLDEEITIKLRAINDQLAAYSRARQNQDLTGKTAILVDDGIATGYTMEAAISATKAKNPAKVVVATPVGSPRLADQFRVLVDDVVVSYAPRTLFAISQCYEDFSQVTDEEVVETLKSFRALHSTEAVVRMELETGAGDEIRTRDLLVGNEKLYH